MVDADPLLCEDLVEYRVLSTTNKQYGFNLSELYILLYTIQVDWFEIIICSRTHYKR